MDDSKNTTNNARFIELLDELQLHWEQGDFRDYRGRGDGIRSSQVIALLDFLITKGVL